jgi:hypothetical protein
VYIVTRLPFPTMSALFSTTYITYRSFLVSRMSALVLSSLRTLYLRDVGSSCSLQVTCRPARTCQRVRCILLLFVSVRLPRSSFHISFSSPCGAVLYLHLQKTMFYPQYVLILVQNTSIGKPEERLELVCG